MTDTPRDLIAAAIAAHEPVTDYDGADGECIECDLNPRWPDSESPTGPTAGWKQHATHIADAILAIPGIAVVELPSFDSIEDDFGVVDNKVRHYLPSGFGAYREYRLDDARDLAAALLAAADYAERDQ